MRKIIVSNLISLDGFMAGPNGDLDWFQVGDDFNKYVEELLREVDVILFGRITYQMMAEYWPTDAARRSDPVVAERMNGLAKVVFSRTLTRVDWENSTLVSTDIGPEIGRLKQLPGRDLVIFGSGSIVSTLLTMNLIDECRLVVNPVLLGSGKPMFAGFADRLTLRLTDMRRFGSGSVLLSYQPASVKPQPQMNTARR
ncbi:MAG: dihydrofolate reductase family protein [Gemmatimonadota bacterium]